MSRTSRVAALLFAMTMTMTGAAEAQAPIGAGVPSPIDAPIYDPPGYYGMAWGSASFGVPRTTSNFASPFGGVGYGYGYDPYGFIQGPFGNGLWHPGPDAARFGFAPGAYRTFPIARDGFKPPPDVPVGYYAPHLGPPIFARP